LLSPRKETLTLLRGAALQPSRVSYSTSITAAGRAQRWRLSVEAFEAWKVGSGGAMTWLTWADTKK